MVRWPLEFSALEFALGSSPVPQASCWCVRRLRGRRPFGELMLSAREFDAQEAVRLHVALEVVPADQLLPRALALATTFTKASALSVSLVKRLTENAGAFERALDAEANAQSLAFLSASHQRSLDQFLNKQPLDFVWSDRLNSSGSPPVKT